MVINWWTDALVLWSVHYGHTSFRECELQNIETLLNRFIFFQMFSTKGMSMSP